MVPWSWDHTILPAFSMSIIAQGVVITHTTAWIATIEWFALWLAFLSVAQRGLRTIVSRTGEWYTNLAQILVTVGMIIGYQFGGETNAIFSTLNVSLKAMGYASMFALHGFMTLTASFRALRFRDIPTTIAVILMLIMMLGQIPVGGLIWEGFGPLGEWLLNNVLTAGTRAIVLTSAVGTSLLGIRFLLLREEGMYGFSKRGAK